jgi:hypothetical protein
MCIFAGNEKGTDMNISPADKLVTQTIAKAAAKTFLQAFIGVLALLLVPTLTNWAVDLQKGGDIQVDASWFVKVLIAAVGAGIAALISTVWNWSKTP